MFQDQTIKSCSLAAFSGFPCSPDLSPKANLLYGELNIPTVEELSETSRDNAFILYGTLSRMLSRGAGLYQLFGDILSLGPSCSLCQRNRCSH